MRKNIQKSGNSSGAIAWALPLPIWNNLVLGSAPVVQSYVVHNNSHSPVTISAVNLLPGGDPRLRIVDGTCHVGVTLLPGTTCSITLEANPKTIGDIQQVLRIQHTGVGSSLRVPIVFFVADRPTRKRSGSYLAAETTEMDRQRRLAEQDGHRRLARVHAREHHEQQQSVAPEGELQNNIMQNPWLDSQRFDGIDPNLNPEPPLNSEARREFDNERREQEMEKQLRLGNMPKFNPAPKPHGP